MKAAGDDRTEFWWWNCENPVFNQLKSVKVFSTLEIVDKITIMQNFGHWLIKIWEMVTLVRTKIVEIALSLRVKNERNSRNQHHFEFGQSKCSLGMNQFKNTCIVFLSIFPFGNISTIDKRYNTWKFMDPLKYWILLSLGYKPPS